MALQVNLTLSKNYFVPGEKVQVCVQIFNDADSASLEVAQGALAPQVVHVKELSFQAYGSERTDSSFIHRLPHPAAPAETLDARKRVRSIFTTESAVLVSNKTLAPHAVQNFRLRFRLPTVLPPSFRGSAVRFLYLIQVKAVYEVHRGDLEAVVYETVASTSLTVWPGTVNPALTGPADRRTTHTDEPSSSGRWAGTSFRHGGPAARSHTSGSPTGDGPTAPGGGAGSRDDGVSTPYASTLGEVGKMPHWASGAGKEMAVKVQSSSPPRPYTAAHGSYSGMLPAAGGGGQGGGGGSLHVGGSVGGDDGDVAMCDYGLGQYCRIKWQEVRDPGYTRLGVAATDAEGLVVSDSILATPGLSSGAALPSGASCALTSLSSFGSIPPPPLRGVIPFGVNRPFTPLFPPHSGADSDGSDVDEERVPGVGRTEDGTAAAGALGRFGVSDEDGGGGESTSPGAAARVQRQVSSGVTAGGGGGVGGLSSFGGRQPSRRGSLFGKVYALNVGDQPLLRVMLQAPLEVPLQSGATFGGILDFRQPLASTAPSSIGKDRGAGGRQVLSCYEVAIMLESEEVISSECRPHPKRDGSGIPAGAPYAVRRLHAEHHESAGDSALTSFTFSLPASATPSFRTPMVSLRWVLRFELAVGPRMDWSVVDKRGRSPRLQLDQLVWSLPLIVRPPVALPR